MEPAPHGMKHLAIALLTLFDRDLKRGREIYPKAWSSDPQVCKNLSLPLSTPGLILLAIESFSWYDTSWLGVGCF